MVIIDMAYGVVCNLMVANAKSGEIAREIAVFERQRYDLMIMGSSRCVCHYDDKLLSDSLGINAINAGYKGNGIILMYGRYHIIPKEHKPKLLLYDVEPAFDINEYKNDDNNRRYLAGMKYYFDKPGIKAIFHDVNWNEPLKMLSQLYRYNSKTLILLGNYLIKNDDHVTYSFYQPSYSNYMATDVNNNQHQKKDSLKLYYFEKLIEETSSDGVRLIVIASPKYRATSIEELETIIELCKKHDVPFWNYYLDMHDKKWFSDDVHLNYEGSQEFTKIISHRISNEALLVPNHTMRSLK